MQDLQQLKQILKILDNTLTINNTRNGEHANIILNGGPRGDVSRIGLLYNGEQNEAGRLELATGDDGTEYIICRQYASPTFDIRSLKHEAKLLLDANGNTSFPGDVKCKSINGCIMNDYYSACETPRIVVVAKDGQTEIGEYLDFHRKDDGLNYSARIMLINVVFTYLSLLFYVNETLSLNYIF